MNTNTFAELTRLISGQPLMLAEVITTSADSPVVQLTSGAQLRVRGAAVAGDSVFIRGGVIDSPAPALPIQTAEL